MQVWRADRRLSDAAARLQRKWIARFRSYSTELHLAEANELKPQGAKRSLASHAGSPSPTEAAPFALALAARRTTHDKRHKGLREHLKTIMGSHAQSSSPDCVGTTVGFERAPASPGHRRSRIQPADSVLRAGKRSHSTVQPTALHHHRKAP